MVKINPTYLGKIESIKLLPFIVSAKDISTEITESDKILYYLTGNSWDRKDTRNNHINVI